MTRSTASAASQISADEAPVTRKRRAGEGAQNGRLGSSSGVRPDRLTSTWGVMEEEQSLRDRLLQAAIAEFAEYGFNGARVDRIAARAKANKQLIYHYFVDKRGLYRETINQMMDTNAVLMTSLVGDSNEPVPLEELFRRSTTVFQGDALRWYYLLGWEGLQQSKDEPVEAYDRRRRGFDDAARAMRAAQDTGKVDASLDTELVGVLLTAVAMAPYLLPQIVRLATGLSTDDPAFQRRYSNFVDLILRRIGRPDEEHHE